LYIDPVSNENPNELALWVCQGFHGWKDYLLLRGLSRARFSGLAELAAEGTGSIMTVRASGETG